MSIDEERKKLQKEYAMLVSKIRVIEARLEALGNSVKLRGSHGNGIARKHTTRSK